MSPKALETAQDIAKKVTDALGGRGIFGVELFVKGDEVWFSEVSPRPHDTGMVTLLSQNLSEFALHVRAILGLPVPLIETRRPGASYVILGEGESNDITFSGVDKALESPDTEVRLFGKPEINGERRLGVALACADDVEKARAQAKVSAAAVNVEYN